MELKTVKVRFCKDCMGVPAGTVRLLPATPAVLQTIAQGWCEEVTEQKAAPAPKPKTKTTKK